VSSDPVVHRCDHGGQGQGILIVCDATWTEPAWAGPPWGADPHAGLPEGVYRADDGRLYTFTAEQVTCAGCCGHKAPEEAA
jgi:hypothetical protein